MKKTSFLMAIITLLLFGACERIMDPKTPAPDYYQLKVGNYWIYENRMILNDTVIVQIYPELDSMYIEKDTTINNLKYYKCIDSKLQFLPFTSYLRDSTGYLVDNNGIIRFSTNDDMDTLNAYTVHDIVRVAYTIDQGDSLVSVQAGSYNCKFYRGTITALKTYFGYTTRTQGDFRASGIGLIMSIGRNAGSDDVRIEKRLVRYHLKDTN
jgi:hypothetical protein